MDKNQYIGLILMFGLLAVYFMYFSPESPPVVEEPTQELPQPTPGNEIQSESTNLEAPIQENPAVDTLKYGAFSFAVGANEEPQTIDTDELSITFSNLGGKIKEVVLKNHKDYLGQSH